MDEMLKVRRHGEAGPELALLHGWGWDSRLMASLADCLAQRFRVVQPDLPGYGLNIDRPCDSFEDCVELLDRTLPDVEIIAGWSLGALLAIAWAARRRPRMLVLIGASPRFMAAEDWPHGMRPERFDAFAADVAEDARRTRTRFAALAALGDADARAVRCRMADLIDDVPPAPAALAQGLQWLHDGDERGVLQTLPVPRLWLHGERDAVIAIAAAQAAAGWGDGQCVEVEGAAHLPWLGGGDVRLLDALLHALHGQEGSGADEEGAL